MLYAKLEGKNVVPIPDDDALTWAKTFEVREKRRVGYTIINRRKGIFVSTVFLGINHDFMGTDRGLWFETMPFGSSLDQRAYRTSTWEEAEKMHAQVVGWVRNSRLTRGQSVKSFKRSMKQLRRMSKWAAKSLGSRAVTV